MSDLTITCNDCGRAFQRSLADAQTLVAKGRRACAFCGGALTGLPETAGPSFDANAIVTYRCSGLCDRSFNAKLGKLVGLARKGRSNCMICGSPLELPASVREALQELTQAGTAGPQEWSLDCLVCARRAKFSFSTPEEVLACTYCGGTFRPPQDPSHPVRLPPLTEAPASSMGIQLLDGFPELGLGAAIVEARTQRGELSMNDAETVLTALVGLKRAGRAGLEELRLPIAADLALPLVATVFLGGRGYTLDRSGVPEMVFIMESNARFLNFTADGLMPEMGSFEADNE
ncbi:hypothetical protein OAX78_03085, partial [Planctomycetota bacterium]|nr:hypothetical protein [Planctomycetota bacterium]